MAAEARKPFVVSEMAGPLVAGRPRGAVGSTVHLTEEEARYERLLGAVVPEGTTLPPYTPPGPVEPGDRLSALRLLEAREPSIAQLETYLAGPGRRIPLLVAGLADAVSETSEASAAILMAAEDIDAKAAQVALDAAAIAALRQLFQTTAGQAVAAAQATGNDLVEFRTAARQIVDAYGQLSIIAVPGLADALAAKATPADINAAIASLTAGSPADLVTFLDAFNRFLVNESAATALMNLVGQKASNAALELHALSANNPHQVNKAQVGLGRVANLAPNEMPISDDVAIAFAAPVPPGTLRANIGEEAATPADVSFASLMGPSGPLGSVVAAVLAGTTPAGFPPRRGQFLAALEASGAGRMATIANAVDPDPGSAVNRAWFHTIFVTPSCALAQFVKATLALNDAQLAALVLAARSVTE